MRKRKEYAVYKGEDLVCMGTAKECSEQMFIQEKSFRFYLTPAYDRRVKERKNPRNYIQVVSLDDE